MTDRPIPFSPPMVRALLDGRKTQTRRLINPQPPECVTSAGVMSRSGEGQTDEWTWLSGDPTDIDSWGCEGEFGTRFVPGDRLYVREEYYQRGHWAPVEGQSTKGGRQKWAFIPADDVILFDAPASFRKGRHSADPATIAWHKRLGRFMPRAASRMTLVVDGVKVERLQAISEADAQAEGIFFDKLGYTAGKLGIATCDQEWSVNPVIAFANLWRKLHGADSWNANPFVVAVTFRVVRGNIDQVAA